MAMAVARSAAEWAEGIGGASSGAPAVVTIGNFDGVHRGHQAILQRVLTRRAAQGGSIAAVLTFYPHPARVLRPEMAPTLLMTLEQRLRAFEDAGVDATLVLRFDGELAKVPAEDFVARFLVETMRTRCVLIGENFRFGHKGAGNVEMLSALGKQQGFEVEIVAPVKVGGIVVSSTAVRAAVREGRVEDAAKLLGRPFALAGEIRAGSGLGRKLVVPTLNLATEQETLPKNGVYATEVVLCGKTYRAATNVGIRPTFDSGRVSIESHLLDFSENVTDGPLEVRFLTRLREEKKFANPDALREQVLRDIACAKQFFTAREAAQPTAAS